MERPKGVYFLVAGHVYLAVLILMGLPGGGKWSEPWRRLVYAFLVSGIALGLWRLRYWARIVALIVCTVFFLAFFPLAVARPLEMLSRLMVHWSIIPWFAFVTWAPWYLLRPQVKRAFGVGGRPSSPSQQPQAPSEGSPSSSAP